MDNPYWDGTAASAGTVGRDFPMQGAALNSDVVHVWGFPASGAVFLGAAYTVQADAQRRLDVGGFSLMVRNAPVGTYPVVVYARDPSTGTFPTSIALPMTIRACVNYIISWPFFGPSGWLGTVPLPYCA
jgi:hypothetical protein